jgi:hypothetical protein
MLSHYHRFYLDTSTAPKTSRCAFELQLQDAYFLLPKHALVTTAYFWSVSAVGGGDCNGSSPYWFLPIVPLLQSNMRPNTIFTNGSHHQKAAESGVEPLHNSADFECDVFRKSLYFTSTYRKWLQN